MLFTLVFIKHLTFHNKVTMNINNVTFIGSFEKEIDCPKNNIPEFAFIGRSNVGKSSLINSLLGRKEMARCSKSPGKTQTLNFFNIDDAYFIVDLPGYGYARISKKMRTKWKIMIDNYLNNRSQLVCTLVLLDARHKLQQIDLDFINFLGENVIPFVIVYTKIDKVKKGDRNKNIDSIRNELLEYWHTLPKEFITSAESNIGREEIIEYFEKLHKEVIE